MKDEGIEFRCGVAVGDDVTFEDLKAECDALIVAVGATVARDLPIPGRQLNGVMFAMEFLTKNTQSLMESNLEDGNYVSAKGKKVIVIGGGDTGNDCIGTSVRHGATSVVNFELLQRPPATRAPDNPWPQWPRTFKIDYGHAEVQAHFGYDPRQFAILSKEFVSDGAGNVKGIRVRSSRYLSDL
jgi:glutamate synthase (NADPH/NADH)